MQFFTINKFLKYSEAITAGSLIVIAFIAYLFYGYAKDKKTYAKKSIFQIIITQLIIFFLVTYGLQRNDKDVLSNKFIFFAWKLGRKEYASFPGA